MSLANRLKNVLFVYLIYEPSKQTTDRNDPGISRKNNARIIRVFNLWNQQHLSSRWQRAGVVLFLSYMDPHGQSGVVVKEVM